MHTCLPKNCVFRNKNHQNSEYSIIFWNTLEKVSAHLRSSYQILRENRRAIHCAPPLPILHSWECCLPITLNCPPVQSFHNSTANFRVHARVTFLINSDERPLLMVCFLKHLETSPFRLRQFCRCPITRLDHAFSRTWNILTNGAPIPKIYLACSSTDVMFSSVNFRETFFCFLSSPTHRAFPRANLHTHIFRTCATRPKKASLSFDTKASATLGENQKGRVSLLLLFHEWQNPELLRGYPYFQNALLILMIFRNK